MNIIFKKKFKCSNGIYYKHEGRIDYETALRTSEYNCLEHTMIHSTKEIYRSWITTPIITEAVIDKPVDQKDVQGLLNEDDKFDIRSEKLFTSLMKDEDYPSFESRVMLVGEHGTGKTTIARYLVGKQPTKFRRSTDGIELFNGLSYFDCQTKEWLSGHLDFSLEEVTVSRCFLHVQEDKRKQTVSFPDTTPTSEDVSDGDQKLKSIESPSRGSPSSIKNFKTACENVKTLSKQQDYSTEKDYTESSYDREICEAPFEKYNPTDDSDDDCSKPVFVGDSHMETITEPGQIKKLKKIFGVSNTVKEVKVSVTKELFFEKSLKVWNKQLHKKRIAPIIIWDFGGQDVFYSTHQTFLTHRAIYIIVLDGSRRLDDPCPYEQYLPGKSGHKTARDYLIYWINTIVTYCRGSFQGFPKIVIVLTHKDKVLATGVENRRHALFAEISKMFQQTPVMQHLVIDDKIFVNTKDANDPEMAMIKGVIIRESEKQPTWGEYLPKCVIPLQLEFASLIRRNIPLITLEHMKKINSLQSVRPLTETELKVFLKFQHSIGKLLYFDKPKLDDRIILSPTLLINAFESIVTDRMFCQGDKEGEELWDVMSKKGVVSKHAIQQIWKKKKYQKFYKDKDYLLDVMTHLDILVEPKRYESDHTHIPADFYYVASMVQDKDDSGYLQSAGFSYRSIAIAFQSPSMMIPPALSFRLVSYCLCVWAVKTYGETHIDMLFHRSGVFTIDPSLDMYIACEDKIIIARLVHTTSNTLIMRNVASSICECLTSALEKISQLYIRPSSDQTQTSDASFISRICCNSPDNPCFLQVNDLANTDPVWTCPAHDIEHNIHTITSWISTEKDDEMCKPGCTVTKEGFLKATPSDLHLHRLSLLYRPFEAKELATYLGLSNTTIDIIYDTTDPSVSRFEILRQCRDSMNVTFKDIKEALETIGNGIHTLCKVVKGRPINFDIEPEKWDMVPTEEHIDRLGPLVGKNSFPFLIELGMDFHTWEHRQSDRDFVRLNTDILKEWKFEFCRMHNLKPTLRTIAQAFSSIGKNKKIIDNALSDLI